MMGTLLYRRIRSKDVALCLNGSHSYSCLDTFIDIVIALDLLLTEGSVSINLAIHLYEFSLLIAQYPYLRLEVTKGIELEDGYSSKCESVSAKFTFRCQRIQG